jgi:sec-independent protein translocase protein TatA
MFSSVFLFFEFTAPEILLIMFVTLLLFGGDKLPGLAKGLGKGIRDFKEASEGVKREITNQIDNFENKKKEEETAKSSEETPLIAEHSTDNLDGKATEDHVLNTMPVNDESHITATDQADTDVSESMIAEKHAQATHVTDHEKTTHD